MPHRRPCRRPLALLATLAGLLAPHAATAQIAVSSNDNKAVLVDGVNTIPVDPRPDTATILDLGVSPPRVIAELDVPGGWSAPPQSVAVAPDESIALVVSSTRLVPGDPTRTEFNDAVTVIDLTASPPRVAGTVRAGLRASGVSINHAGSLALVANRADGTVSVFTIDGTTVTPVGTVAICDTGCAPSLPVFTPDGTRALVSRNGDHRVSVLEVDGTTVTYDGVDISANLGPYSIEVTPDGRRAVVANIGNGPTGGVDTVGVIDIAATPPRLVGAVSVGLIPEGLALSPDGTLVAVAVMNGSNLPPDSPFWNDRGLLKVYRLADTTLELVAEADAGDWCQGIVWSRDGTRIVMQCAADGELRLYDFDGTTLRQAGAIPVSGAPTGIRTAPPAR
jgi:DNA-binding beta-propeller fold protein YncE